MSQPNTPPVLDEDEFDAGTVVPEIKWNFEKFCGPGARGITPEPSDKQLKKMMVGMQRLMIKYNIQGDGTDIASLTQSIGQSLVAKSEEAKEGEEPSEDEDDGEIFGKMMEDMATILAEFASHQPSAEQIMTLPMRVRMKFIGWFMGHFNNPEQ